MVEAIKTAEKVLDEMAEKGEIPRELGQKRFHKYEVLRWKIE